MCISTIWDYALFLGRRRGWFVRASTDGNTCSIPFHLSSRLLSILYGGFPWCFFPASFQGSTTHTTRNCFLAWPPLLLIWPLLIPGYIWKRIQISCILHVSVSWLWVVWFAIPILVDSFPWPFRFTFFSCLDDVFSQTFFPMTHNIHELLCMLAWCEGPLEHSDGARIDEAKHVVSSPECSYILPGGITFYSMLSLHTFDESHSVMIRFGSNTVGVVFTSVPANHLIRCRHQTVGVVFTSVPATCLICGGRQTVGWSSPPCRPSSWFVVGSKTHRRIVPSIIQ